MPTLNVQGSTPGASAPKSLPDPGDVTVDPISKPTGDLDDNDFDLDSEIEDEAAAKNGNSSSRSFEEVFSDGRRSTIRITIPRRSTIPRKPSELHAVVTKRLANNHVFFEEGGKSKSRRRKFNLRRQRARCWNAIFVVLEAVEVCWAKYCRPFVILTSLFELWSMGIWLGFLTYVDMADDLMFIVLIDMFCNVIYVCDTFFHIANFYITAWKEMLEEKEIREANHHHRHSHRGSRHRRTASDEKEKKKQQLDEKASCWKRLMANFAKPKTRQKLKFLCGMFLAGAMFPVQYVLYESLKVGVSNATEVVFVLSFRFARVLWVFRDCATTINQQELEVYVDIRMHGTSGNSGNRVRILLKQFLVVVFVGHWFGCLAYTLRRIPGLHIRTEVESRDYFTKYEDNAMVDFTAGQDLWTSYMLSLYKGFNLNYEDILPERPVDLVVEVLFSIMILLMKSYCIGSFFKFHQKREMEVQRFSKLMECVSQYLDLYEMPPSLRKTVSNHFRFQQANHRKIQTLDVIGKLPYKVQKKIREFEVLPLVVDRNPSLFGNISTEYAMNIVMQLSTQFLQAGEVIFLEKEVPRELVFLDSGAVGFSRTTVQDGKNTEQLMRYVRADRKDDPAELGAAALVLGCPHFFSARVRAGTEVVILCMKRTDFNELNHSYVDQHDLLIQNVAAAHNLDVKGKDSIIVDKSNAEHDSESNAALRADVRRVLISRQSAMETAFTYAAEGGDVRVVKDLLSKRVDPNVHDYDGRSAMHLAASEGRSDVLEALLDAGADPNLKDRWGSTPMQDALKNSFLNAAKLIQKHSGVLELADPAGELCTHASEGNTIRMQQLLDFGVDPNSGDYDGRTALHLSASEGHLPVVTFLTSRGADVNVRDRWNATPIQDAIRNGFPIVAAHLYKHRSRIDNDFAAGVLCDAAARGDLPMLQLLFETGVDMNHGDYDARTALHLVAAEGKVLALDFLVNTARAMPSPVDRWGSTPLQDAITNGHDLCVQVLMNVGADLGPSADSTMKRKVQTMSAELGFGTRGGNIKYASRAEELRKRISAHVELVKHGRARGDIFDPEEAAKFNRSVINSSLRRMPALCKDAIWLSDALITFESAAEPLWQFMRMLHKADRLRSEVHFWGDLVNLKKKAKARKSKDAEDMIFHKAFLAGLRFSTALQSLSESVSNRLVQRVAQLQKGGKRSPPNGAKGGGGAAAANAATRPEPLSEMLAQEVLEELGLAKESDKGGDFGALRKKPASSDGELNKETLSARIEKIAKVLLTGNHTVLALIRGPLSMQQLGPATPLNDMDMNPRGKNEALRPLGQWLEARSEAVLNGNLPSGHPHPPGVDRMAQVPSRYGALWPPRPPAAGSPAPAAASPRAASPRAAPPRAAGGGMHNLLSTSSSMVMTESFELEPEAALTQLVASELVLIALTALVLFGWEQGTNSEFEHGTGMPRRSANLGSNFGLDQGGLLVAKGVCMTKEDFQDIGRICRETALVCRGEYIQDKDKRAHLIKRLKKHVHANNPRDKKKYHSDYAGSDGGSDEEHGKKEAEASAPPAPEAAGAAGAPAPAAGDALTAGAIEQGKAEDVEELLALCESSEDFPIRAGKILAFDKMSADELAALFDIDDFVRTEESASAAAALALVKGRQHSPSKAAHGQHGAHHGLENQASIFGEISKERFVLNMVRCLTNHDEQQTDVLGAYASWEDHRAAAEEGQTIQEACDAYGINPPEIPVGRELEELHREVDFMHEEFSEGPDREVEQEEAEGMAMMLFGGGPPMMSGDILAMEDAARNKKLSFVQVVTWVCRFFGKEGRTRRKNRRIAKRFRELDDDGDGIGTSEMAQLLAVAFNHTLGLEQELRYAYRVFELLEKADVGDLVKLPELLEVLPTLEEEIKDQQRKNRRTASAAEASENSTWLITRVASRMVITPDSQFLVVWDKVRHFVVIFYMFEVPIHFCFLSMTNIEGAGKMVLMAITISADAFMALNIVLTFFRGFVSETKGVVTTFQDIRVNYVFGPFFVDMVACCPLDLWAPEESVVSSLLARPRAALRMVRLLHMRHLHGKGGASAASREAARGFYGAAISMSIFILTLAHFLACAWWLLGTRYSGFDPELIFNSTHEFDRNDHSGRGSWTFAYVHRMGEGPIGAWDGETPFWWQYMIAFYWSAGRLTNQSSPGNIFAASWPELGWTCCLFILNVAINGYCDGILVDKVIAGDEQAIEAKAMRRIVDEYLQTAELPAELIKDVQHSAEECGKVVERERMESLISSLPFSLKQRVAKRIFLPRFHTPLFEVCSETFLVELGAQSRIMVFGKDQPLATEGEPADRLNVLVEGRIGIINDMGMHLAETTTPGEMVGEMPFIFDLKHVVSIVALEESRLMILNKTEFLNACKLYPDDSLALKRSAMKIIQSLSGEVEDDGRSQSRSKLLKSKSSLSFTTTRTSSSSSSAGSQSTTVSHALRRMYAGDLKLVMQKLREEQAAARQELIGNFIQQAADGDVHAVEATLSKGEVHVDDHDYDLRTALHLAVCNGHLEVVKTLIEQQQASIRVKDRFEHSPVDDAVRENQVDIVRYLVALGAEYQVDSDVAAQLCQAAYDNDVPKLKMMLEDVHVNPNVSDYDKRTPLHLGASEGHLAVIELLAAVPAINLSPRDRLGNTPLDDAMRHQHRAARKFLHECGAQMGDKQMGVELCEVAFKNDVPTMKELAESDVSLHVADYDSRTALHLCASENHLSMVTYLLDQAHVDPNPLDRFLHTPLDDAIRHGHKAMQAFLTNRGARSGRDSAMKGKVAEFQEEKKRQDQQLAIEKLEHEAERVEVSKVQEKLSWFRENLSLEDDIHAFASHAASFRTVLLSLVHSGIQPEDYAEGRESEVEDGKTVYADEEAQLGTKEQREMLVERLARELDSNCGKLISVLETEVAPWIQGLGRHEQRLLKTLTPGLQPTLARILDHMKSRTRLTKFISHFWQDGSSPGKVPGYSCPAVGYILQRFLGNGKSGVATGDTAVLRARLEASALVWASGNIAHDGVIAAAQKAKADAALDSDKGRGDGTSSPRKAQSSAAAAASSAAAGSAPTAALAVKEPKEAPSAAPDRFDARSRGSVILFSMLEASALPNAEAVSSRRKTFF